jgi:hypothetical protein
MKRVFCKVAAALAVAGSALGGLSACTDEETGFVILGNVAHIAPACAARADANVPMHLSGVLDVGLRFSYQASLLVGNQLTPRGDKENLRTETQITTITGAEVQLYRDDGSLEREFTVPATGVIVPEDSDDPGFGIVSATLIPSVAGAALAADLEDGRDEIRTRVAEVRVFGKTIGGNEVESSPFTYVIFVCEGCLVKFETSSLDGMGVCRLGFDEDPQEPCFFGQDDEVDCRLCSVDNPICQTI